MSGVCVWWWVEFWQNGFDRLVADPDHNLPIPPVTPQLPPSTVRFNALRFFFLLLFGLVWFVSERAVLC